MGVRLGIVAVLVSFAPVVSAEQDVRSVRVRVERLEDIPESLRAARFAVRVSIGTRRLDETPAKSGPRPSWGRSVRAFTAVKNPLGFEVLVFRENDTRAAPSVNPEPDEQASRRDQDHTLSEGFEELVTDWDSGSSPPRTNGRKPRRPPETETAKADQPAVLCRLQLRWPPQDAEHRLDCRGAVLVVRTQAIRR